MNHPLEALSPVLFIFYIKPSIWWISTAIGHFCWNDPISSEIFDKSDVKFFISSFQHLWSIEINSTAHTFDLFFEALWAQLSVKEERHRSRDVWRCKQSSPDALRHGPAHPQWRECPLLLLSVPALTTLSSFSIETEFGGLALLCL